MKSKIERKESRNIPSIANFSKENAGNMFYEKTIEINTLNTNENF